MMLRVKYITKIMNGEKNKKINLKAKYFNQFI